MRPKVAGIRRFFIRTNSGAERRRKRRPGISVIQEVGTQRSNRSRGYVALGQTVCGSVWRVPAGSGGICAWWGSNHGYGVALDLSSSASGGCQPAGQDPHTWRQSGGRSVLRSSMGTHGGTGYRVPSLVAQSIFVLFMSLSSVQLQHFFSHQLVDHMAPLPVAAHGRQLIQVIGRLCGHQDADPAHVLFALHGFTPFSVIIKHGNLLLLQLRPFSRLFFCLCLQFCLSFGLQVRPPFCRSCPVNVFQGFPCSWANLPLRVPRMVVFRIMSFHRSLTR